MRTKILLELGCNHQGSIEIAKEMILQAAKLGVWGVKFQKRTLSMIPKAAGEAKRDLKNSFGPTYFEHRDALEFDYDQLKYLKDYATDLNLEFVCTAFDVPAIKKLAEFCEYIKLPSQKYSKKNYYEACLDLKNKIIVSTGMHTFKEIFKENWIKSAWCVMHCNSIYPHNYENYNLGILNTLLRARGSGVVGYSSHDDKGYGISLAVIAGAEIIERHFTLSKHMKGSDHSTVSSDFEEMQDIIKRIEEAEKAMGIKDILADEEQKMAERFK